MRGCFFLGVLVFCAPLWSVCGAPSPRSLQPNTLSANGAPHSRFSFLVGRDEQTGLGRGSVEAVVALVGRVLGQDAKAKFDLSMQALYNPKTGAMETTDAFEIGVSPPGGPIAITGNSGVALASGVMWYLKYSNNLSISWGYQAKDESWSCDNLRLPHTLAGVSSPIHVSSPYLFRYYQNVCTVSYSMAWWDWTRWERELDWMALSGINFPLAFTGQEFVWSVVYKSLGLTEDEMAEHFGGPAFLAWARMGNIQGWGGPLPTSWQTKQADLQKQILSRVSELGMTPALSAFDGHVPEAFTRIFPTANITRSASWGNFNDTFTRVWLLDPFDPLFPKIGKLFLDTQASIFGSGEHVYQCDTFNEMDPASGDSDYLKAYSSAVYSAMAQADPDAVWLMQGWLFHSGFWTDDRIAAYLSGVDHDNMIILDLNSEQSPLWTKFVANDKPFIWCMLHNYGGLRDLHGNVSRVSSDPIDALHQAGPLMVGTGITMEAIEQNPIMYELMNEMGWRSEHFDSESWVFDYAFRRYNFSTASTQAAWKLLLSGAYSRPFSWSGNWIGQHVPELQMSYDQSQDPDAIAAAWRLLVSQNVPSQAAGGFFYDVVDITRQVLANFFFDANSGLTNAFQSCGPASWDVCNQTAEGYINVLEGIFDDMESILATDINYLLGVWVHAAESWADNATEKALYRFNARNQLTLWGPDGNINDYAAKSWSGLVGTYYRHRWAVYFETIRAAIAQHNTLVDWGKMKAELVEWGRVWDADNEDFPDTPTGDTMDVALRLLATYGNVKPNYTVTVNTTIDSTKQLLKTWAHNVAQLSILCNADPRCVAFSTEGVLFASAQPAITKQGVDLFVKTQ